MRASLPCISLSCVLAASCGGAGEQSGSAPPMAAPQVQVVVASPGPEVDVVEVPGRVQAYRTAEVRARVDGIVERRLYEEGSDVVEGQELFQIDPREMRAAVSAAEANLQRAQTAVENARRDVERYEGLVADQAISAQEYDAAVARLRTAEADVAQASAELERARLDLSFTTVTAPIAGRAGRAQVTEGALVSASGATLLTRIEQLDPVYVNFSASSGQLLEVRKQIAAGRLQVPALSSVEVALVLEDGSVYAHEGNVDFLDLSFDVETGTAALRAEFPNPDWLLLPGQFVRARVVVGVRPDVTLIPQRAVLFSEQGASVMVVGPENQAMPRPVELGEMREGSWAVLAGLEAGDRVIVDGLQRVQPGQRVEPELADDVAVADSPPDPSSADAGPPAGSP